MTLHKFNKDDPIVQHVKDATLVFVQNLQNLETGYHKGIITLNFVTAFGSIFFIVHYLDEISQLCLLIISWVFLALSVIISLLNALCTAHFRQKTIEAYPRFLIALEFSDDDETKDLIGHQQKLFLIPVFSLISFIVGLVFAFAFAICNL